MKPPQDASPDALFREAQRCRQAAQWQQAEGLYRRVLELAPDHVAALEELASLFAQFGYYQPAADLLARVVELQPGSVSATAGLSRVRAELALSLDPDYAVTPEARWASDDCVLDETNASSTVFVIFAGLGVGRSPPTFIFRKFLAAYQQINKLFVRDLSLSWYLRGIPGIGDGVDATAAGLKDRLRTFERTVFMGCSAGATAAILYGALLGVDKVIAFAPQALLSARKPNELGDARWEQRLAALRQEPVESRYLDVVNLAPFQTPIDIYYHQSEVQDSAHARMFQGQSVTLFPQPGTGHLIALQMRDQGLLRPIIERELLG
ncbi:MAG: hypothetical protein ABI567_01065 [Gammaproteobacteria bacterium]